MILSSSSWFKFSRKNFNSLVPFNVFSPESLSTTQTTIEAVVEVKTPKHGRGGSHLT